MTKGKLLSFIDGGTMLRKLALPIVSVVMIAWVTSACQTNMIRQFDEIKPGMEKAEVLALMGSPNQTIRAHGKDRWFYNFYENRIRFEKEVQFFEGNAVYVGERWQPPVTQSAAAQDALNEKKNQAADEQIAKDVETHRRNYENYEAKSKGEDKVRYVPQFEPVR